MQMKKYGVLGLTVALLLFCLTGCLRVDVGVVIKEDGSATLTSKLMIEEDAYLALSALENGGDSTTEGGEDASDEGTVPDEGTDPDEAGKDDDGSVDLSEFKKEVIDGDVYYSLEETLELASYEELEAYLVAGGDEDGADMFSNVEVKKDGNVYTFKAVTTASGETSSDAPINALSSATLTLTVTMPEEIKETSGNQLDAHTVQFVLDDFAEAQTLSVTSETATMSTGKWVACATCVVALVGAGAYVMLNKKKKTAA